MMGGMGMDPFGGMGGGGFDMGMGGFDQGMQQPQLPNWVSQLDDICERLGMGLVGARVRTRALIELLEEKGILAGEEFDARANTVWERDYDALTEELTPAPPSEEELQQQAAASDAELDEEGQPAAQGINLAGYFNAQISTFIDDFVAARVRLRTVVEVLEEKGVFAEGEYDKKVEAIWDRDYEELVLNFHQGQF